MDVLAQEERALSLPTLVCSIQNLKGLDEAAHTGEGGLTQLLPQMLISSRHTHPDAPRNTVSPALPASLSPVRVTHEIGLPR